MSESMIERVARRLFWQHDGKYAERGMPTWASLDDLTREGFIKDARAVIDEMLEPSEAMVKAAIAESNDVWWLHEFLFGCYENEGGAWKRMIAAALSQSGD